MSGADAILGAGDFGGAGGLAGGLAGSLPSDSSLILPPTASDDLGLSFRPATAVAYAPAVRSLLLALQKNREMESIEPEIALLVGEVTKLDDDTEIVRRALRGLARDDEDADAMLEEAIEAEVGRGRGRDAVRGKRGGKGGDLIPLAMLSTALAKLIGEKTKQAQAIAEMKHQRQTMLEEQHAYVERLSAERFMLAMKKICVTTLGKCVARMMKELPGERHVEVRLFSDKLSVEIEEALRAAVMEME